MKKTRRICSLILSLIMALTMGILSFAAEEYKIQVTNEPKKSNVTINGQKYLAYRLFDVEYAKDSEGKPTGAYSYTISTKFDKFEYSASETQKYKGSELIEYVSEQKENSEELNNIAKQAYKYAKSNNIQEDGNAVAKDEAATIIVDNPGYYLVYGRGIATEQQEIVAACSLNTTNPTAEVKVKAQAPTIDKVIVDADSNSGNGTAVNVGDQVQFKVISKVPNMTGYDKYLYEAYDTMSAGLTFNDDISVTIGNKELKKDEDYTVQWDKRTFIVSMDLKKIEGIKPGDAIEIKYSATVNENALNTKEETNKVYLEYSNDPYDDTKKAKTPDKIVHVYDFEIIIDKYDSTKPDTKTKLSGAEFILYRKNNEKTEYYQWNENDKQVKWIAKADDATKVKTDNEGKASFEGLDSGTYYLHEVKAPKGYNLLSEDIEIIIKATYDSEGELDAENTYIVVGEKKIKATIKEDANVSFTRPVPNTTGVELPSTGSVGTTIFYVIGGLLVVSAVIILVTRKRMQ